MESESASLSVSGHVGHHLRRKLVSGLLILVPVGITYLIVKFLVEVLGEFVKPLLSTFLNLHPTVLTLIAFALTLVLIYLVGLITTHVVGQRLLARVEAILLHVPLVKTIYSASKQMVDSVSMSNKEAFKAVVIVEFPREDCYAIGFVTGTLTDHEEREAYKVFVPTAPNPTGGFLLIIPHEDVSMTTLTVEEGLKMIVSGGVISPNRIVCVEEPAPTAVVDDDEAEDDEGHHREVPPNDRREVGRQESGGGGGGRRNDWRRRR